MGLVKEDKPSVEELGIQSDPGVAFDRDKYWRCGCGHSANFIMVSYPESLHRYTSIVP